MSLAPAEPRPSKSLRQAGRWLVAWLLVLGGLTIWHVRIITSLPYEDQSIALWTEADYLVDTQFDFYRLRYEENHFMAPEPGARSYVISVLPALVATLMIASPNMETTVVVAHLANLGCTALLVVLMYGAARPWAGVLGAVVLCLVLLTTPLFDVQVQMVGMDIPLAAFTLLAATLLWRDRFVWAAVASMAAFFMKATGGLITMTGLVYLVGLLLLGPTLRDASFRRRCLWGLAAHGVALVLQTMIVSVGDESVEMRKLIPWPWILRLPYAFVWAPDVALVLIVSLALSVGLLMWWLGRGVRSGDLSAAWRTTRDHLYEAWVADRQLWICWTFLGGMLMANWMYIFIPRYFTSAMPLLVLALGIVVLQKLPFPRVGQGVLMGLVAVNLVNLHGSLYPPIYALGAPVFDQVPMLHPRSCAFTERSREYQEDHESNVAAMQLLDTEHRDAPVLIAIPQRYYLMKPRLGYVREPHEVLQAETFAKAIRNFRDAMLAAEAGAPEPILYWTGRTRSTLPPPEPGDEILFQDHLDPPLVVYRKRFAEPRPQTAREWEEWYLDKTWPSPWAIDVCISRTDFLVESGRLQRAMDELQQVVQLEPTQAMAARSIEILKEQLLVRRVLAMADEGAIEQATREARAALEEKPNDPVRVDLVREMAQRSAGEGAFAWRGELTAYFPVLAESEMPLARALGRLRSSGIFTSTEPELAEGAQTNAVGKNKAQAAREQYDAGIEMLEEGYWRAARRRFEEALHLGLPADKAAAACLALGMLLLEQNRLEEAAERFESAIELDDSLAEARNQLGLVFLQSERLDEARQHFADAIRQAPLFADAHNNLGVVLVRLEEHRAAWEQFEQASQLEPAHRTAKLNLQVIESREFARGS